MLAVSDSKQQIIKRIDGMAKEVVTSVHPISPG